jgi:DNA-binding CsgD family transcriptional regulator
MKGRGILMIRAWVMRAFVLALVGLLIGLTPRPGVHSAEAAPHWGGRLRLARRKVTQPRPHEIAAAVTNATTIGGLIRSLVSQTKDQVPEQLEEEMEEVILDTDVDGRRYLLIRLPPSQARAPLSPRELEIVRMVAKGHPNKVIAAVLDISTWTVCTHLRRVFAKLGVRSRAAMIARLLERGNPYRRS